jgi:tripartite-type tricarboxylate transporter receptor subunit TctC
MMDHNTNRCAGTWRTKCVHAAVAVVIGVLGVSAGASAQAAEFDGPITMVIPFSPGGSTDIIGRLLADRLSTAVKQPVVVENRAGAGGNIGASLVAKAKPDGRTILFGTTGILSMNEYLYSRPGYKMFEDLVPVVYTASIGNVLIVNPKMPANTGAELLKLLKDNPGKYTFASSGVGSSTHMSGELFKNMAHVDLMHVPYKGSGQALVDLIGGQVDMIFDNAPSALPMVQSGQVKAIAVTSAKRLDAKPDLPTIEESMVPGYESLSWTGVVAPGGTPQPLIDRLNKEINLILEDPDVRKRLSELGATPTGGTPQDFTSHIERERAKWGKVIRDAKMPVL